LVSHLDTNHSQFANGNMAIGKSYYNIVKDPFTAAPSGITDEFAGKTAALRINQTILLSTPTGVSYTAAVVKATTPNASFIQSLTTDAAGVVQTAANTALEGYADLAAHYSLMRPVALGVKAYYTGAEANTAGTISVCVLNGVSTYQSFPADLDTWFNLEDCQTVPAAGMTGPLCATCHNYDRPGFAAWNTSNHLACFPAIGVFGAGLPAATTGVIRLEISFVMEMVPIHGSVLAQSVSKIHPHDPMDQANTARRLPVARLGSEAEVIAEHRASAAETSKSKRASQLAARRKRGMGNGPSGPRSRAVIFTPMGRRRTVASTTRRRKKKRMYRRR